MRLAVAIGVVSAVVGCGAGDTAPASHTTAGSSVATSGGSSSQVVGSPSASGPSSTSSGSPTSSSSTAATSGAGGASSSSATGTEGDVTTTTSGAGGNTDVLPPWQSFDSGGPGTVLLDRNGWTARATLRLEGDRPWEGKQGYPPPDAVDGDPETFWEAGMHQDTYGQRLDQWFMVDLRFPQKFSRMVLDSSTCHPVDSNGANGMTLTSPNNNYPRAFKVEVSQNGKDFTVVAPSAKGTSDLTEVSFAEQNAQYVRMTIMQVVDFPTTWVICELRLYR